jgi:putative ABC transport system ATP-binding protein
MVTSNIATVAVSCRGVTKAFGEGGARTVALRGVDLDVYAGQMTLLTGPSGCGKTTLLSIVAGTLDPTEGSVTLFGHDPSQMSSGQQARFRGQNIGMVFQQYNLLPALTAAENAAVPLLIAGVSRREAITRARVLLEALGMGDRADALPSELSGGQQQRAAIARALVHEPRLLVCDEPTAALDGRAGHAVMELLRRIAVRPARAVIVVTHDNRIFEFGDNIISMNDGRVERVETDSVSGASEVSHDP